MIGDRNVDILIANAGRGLGHAFVEQAPPDWHRVIDTNVTGTTHLLQKVAQKMVAQGDGRILITGSIAGLIPGSYRAVYNGTKAYLDSFWGFVVFTIGSIAWSVVGLSSGQTNLVATNGFLTVVNLIGVWRWLGKQRAYEDGGRSATEASRRSAYPTLLTATGIAGMPVTAHDGEAVGNAVEALFTCDDGKVSYVVVSSSGVGGIGEVLRAVASTEIRFSCESLNLRCGRASFESLPALADGDWPAASPQLEDAGA